MSDIDRAELRRLLSEATPGPWKAEGSQVRGPDRVLVAAAREYSTTVDRPDALIITAAVNALPDLLDALEKAETHRDSLAATLIEVQREKRLLVERVRELHYASDNDSARTPRCEECQGRAGAHPCGCWAYEDRQPVCGHCNASGLGQRVPWPCPTVQALDGGGSDE